MVGEPSEPECSKPMDVELSTAEDALVTEERKEEAQPDPAPTEAVKLKKESSTVNLVLCQILPKLIDNI